MFNLFKKKSTKEKHRAIGSGKVMDLTEVPDQVFSQKMMGDGYAIELTDGHIYAPVSGSVSLVFPTGHAFGIVTDEGVEILIHLGIDTVELNGKGFDGKVTQGDKVKQGDLLTIIDLDYVKSEGKSVISPVIFTSGQKINVLMAGLTCTPQTEDVFEFKS